jgi:hypothetical protein
MILNKYLFYVPVLLAFFHLSAYAQQDTTSLNTIINKTNKLAHQYPTEKVYLHMDKPYYSVGDTIWFKAYVTIGLHQPSDLSRILYVDIVSGRDSIVQDLKIQLFNGIGFGSIALKQGLYKQGNYHLSAYTNWMRNNDPAYFFNKTIPVANPVDNQVFTHITFTNNSKAKTQQQITARIQFKDPAGNPYVNKKVNWTIDTDDDKPLKGKESTDGNGFATIVMAGSKTPILPNNALLTTIDLGNKKLVNNTFLLKTAIAVPDVQFFPEGGSLISGVRTRVAFKAVGANGLGLSVKGTITDNSGTVLADIKSQNLGMGTFVITADDTKTYKANVVFPDGTQAAYDLPKPQLSGVALAIYNNKPDTLSIKITANTAFFEQNKGKPIFIVCQSGGFVCYAAQTFLETPVLTAAILKNKFPTGIMQMTIFSGSLPLSERIAFIQRNDMLDLKLTAAKTVYPTRGLVKVQVTAKEGGKPVEAGLSVAVIDENKVPFNEDAETTIMTSLLLSSDLKGYIEKPNYYFSHPGEKAVNDLDVLMLTQGYRRFLYTDLLKNIMPRINFLPEQSMEITGTLRSGNGMPIAKGNVRLQIPDKNYSTQTTTDMSGNFKFSRLMIPDSSKVILNARNNVNANNLMIMVDGQTLQGISKNINAPDEILNIDSVMYPYLKNTKMQYNSLHTLKEVQIKDKVYVPKPGYQDFPALTGLNFADHQITGDRLTGCNNLALCLQTTLIGMTYENDNFYLTRDYNQGQKTTPVAIYVNGLNVDYNYLSSINPNEVDNVEVFLTDGLSGINRMSNTKGVIEITSKKVPKGKKVSAAQLADLFPPKYIANLSPKGFDVSRAFYSPRYTAPPSVTNSADLRSTIYWNPRLVTDKATGITTFDFYNADAKGTYKAVVEGMDADGNIGRFVLRYKVQ